MLLSDPDLQATFPRSYLWSTSSTSSTPKTHRVDLTFSPFSSWPCVLSCSTIHLHSCWFELKTRRLRTQRISVPRHCHQHHPTSNPTTSPSISPAVSISLPAEPLLLSSKFCSQSELGVIFLRRHIPERYGRKQKGVCIAGAIALLELFQGHTWRFCFPQSRLASLLRDLAGLL